MKAKIAATIILLYAILLFGLAVQGAFIDNHFTALFTIPINGLLFIGPAIGIFRRINWCRILLGIFSVFVFLICMAISLRLGFRPIHLGFLLITGFPIFLIFFYPPLKNFTKDASLPKP